MSTAASMTAEDYAASLLRKAWDGAYTPNLREIADESALTIREVETIRDRLLSGRRDTGHRIPGRVVAAAPAPQPAPAEEWRKALTHPVARIRRKAEKVEAQIAALVADLEAEAGRDRLRAEEKRLSDKLAKVRAELRGTTPAATDRVACPDCGKSFAGAHGLGVHRGRSHT